MMELCLTISHAWKWRGMLMHSLHDVFPETVIG